MRVSSWLSIAALACAAPAPAAAQPYHLEDSLRGSTSGNASGGSFGSSGWTVTSADDRIWYALPRLESGYVEFTLAGVTLANLPRADHELFAMYEAGYGIDEPIDYSPEFRQNHYKVLMRIYGNAESGRAGSIKLMWGMCPSGAPGYDDGSGCGCASFFAEPFHDPGAWTGDPVRIRIEWGDGRTRLLRDGSEVVRVNWADSGLRFGPSDLHLMLGSPRNDTGLSAMPIGAVFSDLVVDGTMGALATCPGGAPDAGPPPDAGACDPSRLAVADATAASWQPSVFPDPNDLNVEGDGTSPPGIVYLRFPPAGGAVTRATLRMRAASISSARGGSGQICRVDGTFDEATLTWSTRPTVSTTCSGGAHMIDAGDEVTWDVTSVVPASGDIVLAVVSTDGDGAHYLSRESGGCADGPRLELALAPGGDGGPPRDAGTARDAGTSGGVDAAAPRMDGGNATTDAGRGHELGSGCGCRAAGSRSAAALGLLPLLALLALRRRRRAQ